MFRSIIFSAFASGFDRIFNFILQSHINMDFCIFHAVILIFFKVTLECSGQIHLPDFLPCSGNCLHHVSMNNKFCILSGWDPTDGVIVFLRFHSCFTGDYHGIFRLRVCGIIGINPKRFTVCFTGNGSINPLDRKSVV